MKHQAAWLHFYPGCSKCIKMWDPTSNWIENKNGELKKLESWERTITGTQYVVVKIDSRVMSVITE